MALCVELIRIIPLECLGEEGTNLLNYTSKNLKTILNSKNDFLDNKLQGDIKNTFFENYRAGKKIDKQQANFSKAKLLGINTIKNFFKVSKSKTGVWL